MNKPKCVISLAVCILAVVLVAGASAQDTNYWTQQYGTQGELLLGTVVGSILDLSAVYYNPGALSLQDNPSFLLGAKAFEYQSLTYHDDQANSTPLQSKNFGAAPTLFAGILPPKWLEGQIGYSALTRQNFDLRINTVLSGTSIVGDPDSLKVVGGEVSVEQDISSIWGGLTWSRAFGKMGAGVSSYVAYFGQRTRYQSLLQALRVSGSGASSTVINSLDYWNVRLVFKFGLAWDYSPLTFGFAVTAPGIGLFGQGSSLVDVFVNGVDIDEDGTPDTELVANYVNDVPADYKSPGSISAGASYRFNNTTIHASAEWFDAVDEYEVMETQFFTSPTTGETYAHKATNELESVFNWGFGVEQHIRDWLKAYGSFITDYSAYVDGTDTNVSVSNWDLYHITGGTAFTFYGTDFTLGLGYSFGSEKFGGLEGYSTSGAAKDLPVENLDGTIKYRRWKFILGFAFGSSS